MVNYYNEFDPGAAEWLRELMDAGQIPPGVVDERSILDVEPSDLEDFTQCHFFAGIGGWAYALRLAGVPDDLPLWTGSPPCQPFSVAGMNEGKNDERHLAPHFVDLVRTCRPGLLFGEQVASAAVFGKAAGSSKRNSTAGPDWAWLDDLSDRLEAARYAVGASDFSSAIVGAPHIRQRTFFGAYDLRSAASGLADVERDGQCGSGNIGAGRRNEPADRRDPSGLVNSIGTGLEGHGRHVGNRDEPGRNDAQSHGPIGASGPVERSHPTNGFWRDADWLFCRDGKWRPVEPGTFPLAHGLSGRVGLLRGYGNAINPWAAKIFIETFMMAYQLEMRKTT